MPHVFSFYRVLCGLVWIGASLAALNVQADEVLLKNGLLLRGTAFKVPGLTISTGKRNNSGPVENLSYWLIDDGVRRYFVFRRQIERSENIADLGAIVSYKLRHEPMQRISTVSSVGGFSVRDPFDQYGRRLISLVTQRGSLAVHQGITEMRPDYSVVDSLNFDWQFAIDTQVLPPEIIRQIVERNSNRNDPTELKAAVSFYVQTQLYELAQAELQLLATRFPEQASWCEEFQRTLNELIARKAMNEIDRRRQAGQHQLAMEYAHQFPANQVSADISRRAQEVLDDYEQAVIDRDQVLMQLDLLQAALPVETASRLNAMRAMLLDELQYELMERLQPFLRAVEDPTLPADEKLALAYSGWVLGNAYAITSLEESIRLWDARFQVLEYLRTHQDPVRDQLILETLGQLEGISVERVAQMIPHLPMPIQTSRPAAGELVEVDLPGDGQQPDAGYSLILPPEYSPAHRFPLLVVLRPEHLSFAGTARWWAGDAERPGWAQRRGYIVIAPHSCDEKARAYQPTGGAGDIVLRAIQHVRQRYHVDSNRVMLAGHGMGADACFDIAMSHPEVFAGVIPICGASNPLCRAYRENGPSLAWYVVGGERDRNLLEQNAGLLNEMMNDGQNVLYCDYKLRGFEMYAEEQERIFEWMQSVRRAPEVDSIRFKAATLRKGDDRFYWVQGHGFPDRLFPPISWDSPQPHMPASKNVSGDITPTGMIRVSHPGTKTTIWLSPAFYDFNNKCQVRVNQRDRFNDYVRPSLEALLSDLRIRGDRERLYWARLDL